MKSIHLFPSIDQVAFSPNVLLLHWNSTGANHTAGIKCLLDILEAWEAKKYRSILLYVLSVTFPSSKKQGPIISFLDKAHHTITDGEF